MLFNATFEKDKRLNRVRNYYFNNHNNRKNDRRNETLQGFSRENRAFSCWQTEEIAKRPGFDDEIGDGGSGDGGEEEGKREMMQDWDSEDADVNHYLHDQGK